MAEAVATSEVPRPLAEWLAAGATWPVRDALVLVRRVAQQVQSLHQAGSTHRAIGVESVTSRPDQGAGLAGRTPPDGRADPSAPSPVLFAEPQLGPPAGPRRFGGEDSDPEFCPPELAGAAVLTLPQDIAAAAAILQRHGHTLDPRRIDIYQLGALLSRLVTGDGMLAYIYQPAAKARVPAIARSVLARALGVDDARPFADCEQLLAALDEAIDQAHTLETPRSSHETPPRGSVVGMEGDTPPEGHPSEKGTGPICAEHPEGRAGKLDLSPFPTTMPLPFERLGHYRILGRIGRGGMGDVYQAYDESLGRSVALKVLPAELARDLDFVRRFHNEAQAAARVAHPNVVRVYYSGEEAGHHFFAMQLIEGESLAQRLARQKRLPLGESLAVAQHCLAGLQAAHAQGLIHRDIKPGNILLDQQTGRAVLVDFGLVRNLGHSTQMTATGVVMGTVDYIAPEQARGQKVDGRADIYSLGVLLYQLLSGRLPFVADTPTAMLFQHAYERPFPLQEAAPDVPQPLIEIIARMMAKRPDDRQASCAEVLADLQALGKGDRSNLPERPEGGYPLGGAQIGPVPFPEPADTTAFPSPLGSVDEAALAEKLDWLVGHGRWQRLRDLAATLFRRHAPEFVKDLQTTTQQVDGAVAEYERRRRRLAKLVEEGHGIVADLAGLLEANQQAATAAQQQVASALTDEQRQAAQAKQGECEEHVVSLGKQHAEQQRQIEDLELQLAKADATLAQLRSRRDLLEARLKAAAAPSATQGRHRWSLPRRWLIAGAVAALLVLAAASWLLVGRLLAPADTAVDLLALIQPERDAFEGTWFWEEGSLVCSGQGRELLQIPYAPPDEYDLLVDAERMSGDRLGSIGLVVGARQVMVLVDQHPEVGYCSGLHIVDGVHACVKARGDVCRGPLTQAGTPVAIRCQVRRSGSEYAVVATCDDRPIVNWTGDPSSLSVDLPHQPPRGDTLFLMAQESRLRITKVQLVPVSGEGRMATEPVNSASGKPIDLLQFAEARGDWRFEGRALVGETPSPPMGMTVQYPCPEQYDLAITVESLAGENSVNPSIIVGGRGVELSINGWPEQGYCSGLRSIDGKMAPNRNDVYRGRLLHTGRPATIQIAVRKTGGEYTIRAACESCQIANWQGRPERLLPRPPDGPPTSPDGPRKYRFMGLVSWNKKVRITKMELVPIADAEKTPGGQVDGQKVSRTVSGPALAVAPFDAAKARVHQEVWAKHLGVPVEVTNSVGAKLALIPPGEFMMGSSPEQIAWFKGTGAGRDRNDGWYQRQVSSEWQHRVRISRPFYMGACEVTQAEYQRVIGTNPSSFSPTGTNAAKVAGQDASRHPVETVSWNDATEFCRRLSAVAGEKTARRVYRLPTEAEWEYACRAGTTTKWFHGDDEAKLAEYAWANESPSAPPRPVGQKKPNAWGLHDMLGNVYEWCFDWINLDYYHKSPLIDPVCQSNPAFRSHVLRGAEWWSTPGRCRPAWRSNSNQATRKSWIGFRVVCEIAEKK